MVLADANSHSVCRIKSNGLTIGGFWNTKLLVATRK